MSTSPQLDPSTQDRKDLIVIPRRHAFWALAAVFGIAFPVGAILFLNFGLVTGYEGEETYNLSRVGDAVGYLFGGVDQLFSFVGVIVVVALLLMGAAKLMRRSHTIWAAICGVAVFILGGLTFQQIASDIDIIPMLAFLASILGMAGVSVFALALNKGTSHQKGGA